MRARSEPLWLKQIRNRGLPRSAFAATRNAPPETPLRALRQQTTQRLAEVGQQAAQRLAEVGQLFRGMLRDQGGFLRTGWQLEPAARVAAGEFVQRVAQRVGNPQAAAMLVLAAIACVVVALPILAAIDALRPPRPSAQPVPVAAERLTEAAPLATEPVRVAEPMRMAETGAAAAESEPPTGSIHPKTDVTTPIEALVPAEPPAAAPPLPRPNPGDKVRAPRVEREADRAPQQLSADRSRNAAKQAFPGRRQQAAVKQVRATLQQRRSAQATARVDPRRCAASERCPEVDQR